VKRLGMKRLVMFGLLLLLSLPAAAEEGQVKYAGGTAPGLNAGSVGRLDTTPETSLLFQYGGVKLMIPYASIESFDHSMEVARHLGVVPAMAVGLVKMRQRRHFFRIAYRDSNQVAQVAVFEVPKQMARALQATLETRAPLAYKPCPASSPRKCP